MNQHTNTWMEAGALDKQELKTYVKICIYQTNNEISWAIFMIKELSKHQVAARAGCMDITESALLGEYI